MKLDDEEQEEKEERGQWQGISRLTFLSGSGLQDGSAEFVKRLNIWYCTEANQTSNNKDEINYRYIYIT